MAKVSEAGVSLDSKELVIVIAAGFGLIGFLYWLGRKTVSDTVDFVGDTAKKAATVVAPVVTAFNPASQDNIVQKIGTAVYQITDQKKAQQGLTLSTAIVDFFNLGGVNSYDPNANPDNPRG